jgi:hypothetical protein
VDVIIVNVVQVPAVVIVVGIPGLCKICVAYNIIVYRNDTTNEVIELPGL